jgi:RNase adaptor protein for sRNA GlmZ degradation
MQDDQEQLFSYYLQSLGKIIEIDESEFRKEYYTLALLRILQVLGTYGLRGLMEKKAVFIQSIPHGLRNLQFILQKTDPSHISSTLNEILTSLAASGEQYASLPPDFEGLTISIFSFSYRKALPDDIGGNGGGFVYDCRYLPNPGRFEKYRSLTGFDDEVQEFLNNEIQVSKFIDSIKSQVQNVVDTYTERKFKNLMLSFGCTGGQHRSVYVASRIAEWSRKMPDVRVIEKHREIGVFR